MTENGTTPDDVDLLLAEYVLGVLPHDERVALAARIAAEPQMQARMRFWEERLAPMGASLAPVQPPAAVLEAVERRLFPAPAPAPGLWGSLSFWRALAVGLFCVLLAGAGLLFLERSLAPVTPAASYVAELSGASQAVRVLAIYDGASGTLKLQRVAGEPAAGRDFQLWLIEGDAAPLSLGVLPREKTAALAVPAALAAKLGPKTVLAVSDEPLGGSPTGLPTGAVLATGALTAI